MRPENTTTPRIHSLDEHFAPHRCPNEHCPSNATNAPSSDNSTPSFAFHRKGSFDRACDLRVVQRFKCLLCRRGFSSQTFRLDYRYHRPRLHLALFPRLVSKGSLRQAARELSCHRDSLLLRLGRVGPHSSWLTQAFLERHKRLGPGLQGTFQLDELETFECDRRLRPVTLPVLIHARSRFVVHAQSAALPARGGLRPCDQARLEAAEKRFGKRTSGSREAVTACFELLRSKRAKGTSLVLWTDQKHSYPSILKAVLKERFQHRTVHSKEPRGMKNPLFPINHTLAMLRDGMGRLVRRNWGHSKLRRNLDWHVWVWALYRNFVREWKNTKRATSAGIELGIVKRKLEIDELWEWNDRLPAAA